MSSWVQEGSVEGYHAARAAGPTVRTRTAPAIRLTGQDAGPYNPRKRRGPKEDEAAKGSRRPSRSGPERGACAAAGLRPLPGHFLLEHCPSFTNPAARRGHQIPCLFCTLFPFGHFIILFMLNKRRHAHCVCRLFFPPHWWRMRAGGA